MNLSSESWQEALFAAVMETSRIRALPLIRSACSILDCGLAHITYGDPEYLAELLDLWNSQICLNIPLQRIDDERGGVLWD